MSTKTTFKRIALVAVAALGLGVLSVAPSQAAVSSVTLTVANGTAGLVGAASDSTTAATIKFGALFENGQADTFTVAFVEKSRPALATGTLMPALMYMDSSTPLGGTIVKKDTTTVAATLSSPLETTTGYFGVSSTGTSAKYVMANFGLQLDSVASTGRVAGTYTYTVLVKTYLGGSLQTALGTTYTADVSIVIAAAASASETPSSAYSAVFLGNGATVSPTADSSTINTVATASTTSKAANLNVMIRNALNGTAAVDTVTITLAGPGLIKNGTAYTKYIKAIGASGDNNYEIYPDGTAGTATITVSYEVTGQSFTKTMNFYSAAAKTITAASFNPVLAAGANDSAIAVVATDANGTSWRGQAYIVASSAADALVAGSTTPVACAAWNSTTGILCPVTAKTLGTAKLKVIDASTVALATATSNEVSVTVKSQVAASVKLAFDKATYAPGEKALITVTPLDSTGSAVQGKSWSALLASGGITSNTAFSAGSDTLTATALTTSTYSSATSNLNAGSYTYVVYMPLSSGDVVLTAKGGADIAAAGQVTVTATASVVNSSVDAATDAANEATDAANAATDAALAAADAADAATAAAQDASDAVAALSASVSKMISNLRAQITSLTNLVIKIQKKVRA